MKTGTTETSLGSFKCPVLVIRTVDYLEAYELERGKKGNYSPNRRNKAFKDLESLQTPRKIYFQKSSWQKGKKGKKGKWVNQIVDYQVQLVALKKLTSTKSIISQGVSGYCKYLQIAVSPALFFRIEEDFILKPRGLFKAISNSVRNKNERAGKAIYNLILMFLQGDRDEYQIFRDNLIHKLELDYRLKARQQSLIDFQISEAIKVATDLGYLLEYKFLAREEKYIFYPNKEQCSRQKRKAEKSLLSALSKSELMMVQQTWELTNCFF